MNVGLVDNDFIYLIKDLLALPNSDLVGLIRRHVGLFRKLSLWSFNVMNDSLGANFFGQKPSLRC